jgi:2-dehydro-3-deoxyphosphogluconate aldolase/(4S)-4-hydroxy-2-oxoglutarate aldolase
MDKEKTLQIIQECGVVAVVRAKTSEEALKIAEACRAGGILGIEITFTVPGAEGIIRALTQKYKPEEMLVGAGTVMDPETARIAIMAGANYIVSPCLNLETVKLCNRYRVACMPGAMTLKEAVMCMEAGAEVVKIFPASLFGPKIIKAFLGPLPQIKMMPTGGVSPENCGEWIAAGAVAVGAGGELTAGAKMGDFEAVTRIAAEMVACVKAAREAKNK